MKSDSPIACNLGALSEAERKRRAELADHLQKSVQGIGSMADGYTIRMPWNDQTLREVVEFISLERRCCPFLNFQMNLNVGDDAMELRLSGREGVKEFLAAEFGLEQNCC